MDKKKALVSHLKRAKKKFDDPNTETGDNFGEFFQNQYMKENGKKGSNAMVIDHYMEMLAEARGNQPPPQQGLLEAIQGNVDKGPYPANEEEDEHLLAQLMKFIHKSKIKDDVFKMMKTANKNLAQLISQTAANVSARLLLEVRKRRPVSEPVEKTVLRICIEELWTIAKNLGLQDITPEIVESSTMVAENEFDKIEEQVKTKQQRPSPQQGQPQGQPQQQPQEQPPQQQGGLLA